MKMNIGKKMAVAAMAAGVCFSALQASAVTINMLNYGVGYYDPNLTPGQVGISDIDDMINFYNNNQSHGNGYSGTVDGTTAYIDQGSSTPAPNLPTPSTLLAEVGNQTGTSLPITVPGNALYLIAQWDGTWDAFYYVGGLVDGNAQDTTSITLQNVEFTNKNGQPQNISGYWFATGTVPSVPDGGSTVLLLGAALAGITMIRRKLA